MTRRDATLEEILDHVTEAVCRFRPDGTLVYVNEAYCKMLDVRREDIVGTKYAPVVHPDDLARVEAEIASLTPDRPEGVIENRVLKDGEVRWARWCNIGFFDDRGELVEVQSSGRDITARVRAEADLERQIERFRFLAEASRILGGSLDYQTTLREVVRLAVPFLADGCSVSLLDDRGEWERLAVANVDPEIERTAAEQSPIERRTMAEGLRRLSNTLLAGEAILVPTFTDEDIDRMGLDPETAETVRRQQTQSYMLVPLATRNDVLGAMAFTSSRAQSKRTYTRQDLELAEELARRAAQAIENARLVHELREHDQRKDRFLATLGHELRNPLAAVQHALDVIELAGADDASREHALEVARRQVRHQARLVDDLLDIARLTRGAAALRREVVDASECVTQAVDAHRAFADRRKQKIELETESRSWVSADPSRLQQIVGNLVDNAIKYSPPGSTIHVSVGKIDDSVRIAVTDQGPGIPADLRAQVFEPFVQGEPTHELPSAGLGIGMTIVGQLVELHYGAIDILDGPGGKGTQIVVTLPSAVATRVDRRPTPNGELGAMHILVVDDNQDAADMLASLLGAWGHHTRAVYSGRDAVEAVRAHDPDLVLIDIGMPEMDGYDTARALRSPEVASKARLVALTGYARSSDVAAALEAGFESHVAKPVDGVTLRKLIQQ